MRNLRSSFLSAGILAIVLCALTPLAAQAQNGDRPVGVGGKAAWNMSRVRGDIVSDIGEIVDFGTGNGYSFGGVVGIDAGPNVTIQPEFLYSRKKVQADLSSQGIRADGSIDTDWFEIPVIIKLHGARARGARPFGLAGVTTSFLVNAEQTISALGMSATQDIQDEVVSTDFGLTFGGGVDFVQDWGVFTIDARYTLGMRRLGKDGEDDIKQDTFAISGGFIF